MVMRASASQFQMQIFLSKVDEIKISKKVERFEIRTMPDVPAILKLNNYFYQHFIFLIVFNVRQSCVLSLIKLNLIVPSKSPVIRKSP